MKKRLLTLLIIAIAGPTLAQQATPAAFVQQPASVQQNALFVQQKNLIDSLVKIADDEDLFEHSVFNGRARVGKYRVECFYNTPSKELLKMNFLFMTDSLNFRRTYYFKANNLIKVKDDSTSDFYQVGDHLVNTQGGIINQTLSKNLISVIADTYQSLYAALFP
jgi:hypothetical protein